MTRTQCNRRNFLKASGLGLASLAIATSAIKALAAESRPNILLILLEDMSPFFTFYGHTKTQTPAVDAFAKEGVIYTNAFVAVGVCAPETNSLVRQSIQRRGAHVWVARVGHSLPPVFVGQYHHNVWSVGHCPSIG